MMKYRGYNVHFSALGYDVLYQRFGITALTLIYLILVGVHFVLEVAYIHTGGAKWID